MQNDGDVKIVVGNNFDEIVLDELKDVLLEVYIEQSYIWNWNHISHFLYFL